MIFGHIYLIVFEPTFILPKEVWHPFLIDPFRKRCLVAIQQILCIIHCGIISCIDNIIVMLIQTATLKLKVLSDEFKRIATNFQLKKCIQKHQKILW